MLKYIGAALILAGISLFVLTIMSGRRKGIKNDAAELSMITGAGYASEHVAETKERRRIESTRPRKRRNRELSEESRSILELVERARSGRNDGSAGQKEKETGIKDAAATRAPDPRKGTDTLPQNTGRAGTAVLEESITYTEVLNRPSGTDVLTDEHTAGRRGTAFLPDDPSGKRGKGTAVLEEEPSPRRNKGTDVLPAAEAKRPRKGTDVLPSEAAVRPRKGTDVLPDTVLKQRKGTDVLPPDPVTRSRRGTEALPAETATGRRKGTDVLPAEAGTLTEADDPKRNSGSSTDVLIEEVSGASAKGKRRKGADVLEKEV